MKNVWFWIYLYIILFNKENKFFILNLKNFFIYLFFFEKDGDNGEPKITHGNTLTSSISLESVL